MSDQWVVCAAVRLKDGLIVCGPRHFDKIMRAQFDAACGDRLDERLAGAEQGFVDQFGKFLSRMDAYQIARNVPQRYRKGGGWPHGFQALFSEDLY